MPFAKNKRRVFNFKIMSSNSQLPFPNLFIWELTEKCNFKCLHCYNIGENSGVKGFKREKALDICDQLIELKPKDILLSGGEVLLSDIWEDVASKLCDADITTGIISNGWILDEQMIDRIKETGMRWVCISLDGIEETHDQVRQANSFKRIMSALDRLKQEGIYVGISTAINKLNINQLEQMYAVLCEKKVDMWQLQLAVPEGASCINENKLILDPSQIDTIIDFVYERYQDSPLSINLGDCIGHYNAKEIEIRSKDNNKDLGIMSFVDGCQAGIRTAAIKANGNFTACVSLSHPFYSAGSVYERSIADLWNDPESFAWNRNFDKMNLVGDCKECVYGEYCGSGCPSFKFDENFKLVENKHCSYNHALKENRSKKFEVS